MNGDRPNGRPNRLHHLRPLVEAPKAERPWKTSQPQPGGAPDQTAATAISDAVIALFRAHAGSEPSSASTLMSPDLAVVTLHDWPTAAERTLGEGDFTLVMQMRTALHRGMRAEATEAVEEITGRRVVAYFTDQHHDPDIAIIAFHFEPSSNFGAA